MEVYDHTPDVVYVGYTPGYMWTYPYYGVPVYGTGWYYTPYYGGAYYPRPVTFGIHVGYNPWTGWSMGMSWSTGFFTFRVRFGGGYPGYHRLYRGGYYPPGGYRRPVVINTGNINIGNTVVAGNRNRRPSTVGRGNRNLYNRPENRARVADRGTREAASRQLKADRTARGPNNVFADKNGNVHRRTSNGWESRDGNSWKPERSGAGARDTRPSASGGNRAAAPSYNPSHGMERDWQARQRGASRSSGGGGRSMPRGGGGRRR
ncbi:MAG: hypothetical protein ACREMV_09770 [Gemmatimonadales bacterium]